MALNENLSDFFASPQVGLDSIDAPPSTVTQRPRAETPPRPIPSADLSAAPKWTDIETKPEFRGLTPEKQSEAKAAYFDYWVAPHAGEQTAALRQQFLARPEQPQPAPVRPANKDANIATDVGNLAGIGVNTMAQNVRELVGRIPGVGKTIVDKLDGIDKWATGKSSEELLKGNVKAGQERLTPEMQEAGERKWWDSDKGTFGDAWSDPRSYVSGIVQSLPEQALTMIPAMRLAKGIYASKIAAGVAPQVASAAAARAATLAGAVSEGSLAGAASSREVRDKIMAMKPDQMHGSEAVQALMSQGMTFEQARQTIANDAATQAFITSGVATGAFGGFGDRMLAKAMTEGIGKNVVGRVVKGMVGEGVLEEFPQETLGAVAENAALRRADPRIALTDDALNRGLGGLATGGIQGGAMAGVMGRNAGTATRQEPAARSQPTAADVTPDGRLETDGTDHGLERDAPVVSAMREAALQPAEVPMAEVPASPPSPEPMGQPSTPAEPVAPNVHPSQAAADAIVRQVAEQAGIPLETLLPTPQAPAIDTQLNAETVPPSPSPDPMPGEVEDPGEAVADQDVLDFAAGRYQQLRTKRDGDTRPMMTDNGIEDSDVPGVPLSAQEAREMAALESARGDADALRTFYGLERPAAQPAAADMSTRTDEELRQQMRNAGSRSVQRLIAEELQRRRVQASEMPATLPLDAQNTAQLDAAPPAFNTSDAGYTRPDAAPDADIAALEAIYDYGREDTVRDGRRDDLAGAVHPFRRVPVSALRGVADIAEAFGKRVVGFAVDPGVLSKGFGSFNGVTWPRGAGNRIFINQDADRPHLAVLGHEIAHQMAKTRPELYARMVEAIRPYIDQREYLSAFTRTSVARGAVSDGMTREQKGAAVREEFIGEVLSDGFMDPDFWRALGAKNKQLLAQVQAFVGRLIQKVMSTVGYTRRTEQFLTDYQRVMQIAGEVMAEYGMDQTRLNDAAGIPTFMFAGERAQTADTQALAEAKQRLEAGQDAEQVRRATGWFQGVDGKWRFEFDDSRARLKAQYRGAGKTWGNVHAGIGTDVRLATLIDHPTLFTTYPEFQGLTVGLQSGKGASFNTESGQILIGASVPMADVLSKVLHEVQHAVQTKEGFAKGWNRDTALTPAMRERVMENIAADGGDPREAAAFVDGQIGRELTYQWTAGEVEARNVQRRQGMTPAQRRSTPPSETADVPERSQIVVTGDGPTSVSQSDLSPRAQREAIAQEFGDVAFTKFNVLHNTVGTQQHKAQISPEFRRVFDTANALEAAGTLVAVRTAELAPGVLPKALNLVTAAKQLVLGRKAAKESQAATTAILEGTTLGKTVLDGKVWSDDELRQRFQLSEQGIALYRQMRASIDAAVFEVAAAEAYAMSALYVKPAERKALRDLFVDDTAAGIKKLVASLDSMIVLSRRAVAVKRRSGGADEQLASFEAMLADQEDTRRRVDEVMDFAKTLARVGYAPLMRFGRYTVTVQEKDPATGLLARDDDGKPVPPVYFERFETEAEARDAYFTQGARFAGMSDRIRISTGTVNEDEYKLYAGVSPEVVALFAEKIGNKAVQEMLTKVAVSDQSILKRQLNRKNVPGFSREYDRVLAKFVTSSGRWAASKYYMSDLRRSVKNIRQRDVQAQAQKLVEYVTDQKVDSGQDVSSAVSSLAFTWFLGGPTNIGAALVNFLQVGTLLPQHLVKTTTTAKAAAAIGKAYPAALGMKELPADLRAALKKAEQEGKVDAQEVHHLYNIGIQGIQAVVTDYISRVPGGDRASRALLAARYRLQAAGVLWGAMFGAVESLNRRVTFISAWNVAQSEGLKDPFAYAINAVDETQGIYTKANRPNLARNPLGRSVLTFKMVPTIWIEILVRNLKYGGTLGYYAAALQVATMILLGGIAGLPFEDDLIDIIDTVAQRMGYNWNTKQERERWAKETFGQLWGEAVISGVSAFLPVDLAGRLGVANLVPSTGLLKKSNEGRREREVAEAFGVGGSLALMGIDAFDAANAGRMDRAMLAMAPTSVRNLAMGMEMATTGVARDLATGKKKADATPTEGAFKAIGLNPQSLAQAGQARFYESQSIAMARITAKEIGDTWAEGIATGNQALVDKAVNDQQEWNRKNPDYPINVIGRRSREKVRAFNQDADTRMLRSAPKKWRGTVSRNLGLDDLDDE